MIHLWISSGKKEKKRTETIPCPPLSIVCRRSSTVGLLSIEKTVNYISLDSNMKEDYRMLLLDRRGKKKHSCVTESLT